MRHPLAMSSSDSDASEEEDFPRVQNLGRQGRTYSKKASRVEVSFKEDNYWDNMVDNQKSGRGNFKETKEKAMSNEASTEENFFLFQSSSRGVVGNIGCEERKSSTRRKRKKTTEDATPKKAKKLPLAPASKSPTEEDCSYGWQQSCWNCSGKFAHLRLCSGCQVAAYCSTHCQKEGWRIHEERCKRERGAQASESILIDEKRRSKIKVKKAVGSSKTVKESLKAQADDGQAATRGDEVGPGGEGEVAKTVCFNSQPQFAPSQEVTHFNRDEESRPGYFPNTEVGTSPMQPKSILKIPKEPTDSTTTPENAFRCPVKSPPIDLTSSPSQTSPTPPPVDKQARPKTSLPTSPTTPSALEQVDVTPPNSPSVLASVRKGSQAKPKSERRRSTPYPQGAHTRVKLMEEVEEEEERCEVDEEEEGAGVGGEEMEVEDRGLWLKPQRLDFADISELEFDSNWTDQEGSTCDELNTVQEIQFSSQSTEERGINRSPDMFSSQDDLLFSQY